MTAPATNMSPVSWDEAFAEIGARAQERSDSPDRAEFYTSGRAPPTRQLSLYQLLVRLYGTNNFPDCSNMCHEASGVGTDQAPIGVGKGTVLLEDFEHADAIFVHRPEPRHQPPTHAGRPAPCGAAWCDVSSSSIRSREKGLERFADPQDKIEMITGGSAKIATNYYQPRQGGDMAAVRGMSQGDVCSR